MINKLITLFKLGRKIAKSDILKIASKFKKPPLAVTILFQILSISFEKKEQNNLIEDDGERLSISLESMGTTIINKNISLMHICMKKTISYSMS